jgi:hypothetical protein
MTESVFENQNLIANFARRRAFGIIAPARDPQTALGVPGHLHRSDKIGKLFFAREEIHFHPRMHGHFRDCFFTAEERPFVFRQRAGFVRLDRGNRRKIRIIHDKVGAIGERPDAFVAVRGHHIALRHFLLHHFVIRDLRPAFSGLVSHLRTPAINVVAINRTIARMPYRALVIYRRAQLGKVTARRPFVKQLLEDHTGDQFIAPR